MNTGTLKTLHDGAVVRITTLSRARFALSCAKAYKAPLSLISASWAGFSYGPLWWKAMSDILDQEKTLYPNTSFSLLYDCQQSPALTIEALRCGLKFIAMDRDDLDFALVLALCTAYQATLYASPPEVFDFTKEDCSPTDVKAYISHYAKHR